MQAVATQRRSPEMSALERAFRESGMRVNSHRLLLARMLANASDHPTARELHDRARLVDPRVSITTVYRFVSALADAGLLRTHEFGDGKLRYEDALREDHDHLIDESTGAVINFSDPMIRVAIETALAKRGLSLRSYRLAVVFDHMS